MNPARSYVFLRVKLLFDNSTLSGPVIQALEKQVKELEWRLMVQADPYFPPTNLPEDDDDFIVIDGGGP